MANLQAFPTYMLVSGSGTMWDDFKIGIPGIYQSVDIKFNRWIADQFTATEVETSGTVSQTILDVDGGALRLTAGGTENDGCQIQLGGTGDGETTGEAFAAVASKKLYFETEFRGDDIDQTDVFVGLHVQDTTIIAGRGSDYIGFRTDDGDALLDVESAASSSASDQTSVDTLTDSTWVKCGIKINGTDNAEFWVDNRLAATISSDIPTALMKLTLAMLTGEGTANTVDFKYVRCYKEI